MRNLLFFLLIMSASGCTTPHWMKVNCGWTNEVLPIQASRKDTLKTQRQILKANEAQEQNCR